MISIYTLSCPITKKVRYIGQTINPKIRYKQPYKDFKFEYEKEKIEINLPENQTVTNYLKNK